MVAHWAAVLAGQLDVRWVASKAGYSVDYWDVRKVAAKAVSSVVPMVCQWVDGSAVS